MGYAVVTNYYNLCARMVSNCYIARPITLAPGWKHIRLGARACCVLGTNINLTNVTFAMGFCSGTTAMFDANPCTHFIGVTVSPTWTYNGGWYDGLTMYPTKRVGSTTTLGTAATTIGRFVAVGSAYDLSTAHIIDIYSGSSDYSFEITYRNAVNTGLVLTQAMFLSMMESPVIVNQTHATSSRTTLPVDESTNGTLNAIQIYWYEPNNLLPMVIQDVAWSRMS